MTRSIILGFAFSLVLTSPLFAQKEISDRQLDSIKNAYLKDLAFKNPALRQVHITNEYRGSGKISSKLKGNDLMEGEIKSLRYGVKFDIPILHKGNFMFSSTLGFQHETFDLTKVENFNPQIEVTNNTFEKNLFSLSLKATRLDTLFGLPNVSSLITTGYINPETSQTRFSLTGLTLFTLKKTERSTFSVGAILSVDPQAPFPFIPFISYYHKFKSPGLELFLDPSRLALTQQIGKRNRLMFSNSIEGTMALFELGNPSLPEKSSYSTLEIRSGLKFEHLVSKSIVIGLDAGVSSTVSSKFLEQGKATNPFIKNNLKQVPYVQIGISVLPFWKGFVK